MLRLSLDVTCHGDSAALGREVGMLDSLRDLPRRASEEWGRRQRTHPHTVVDELRAQETRHLSSRGDGQDLGGREREGDGIRGFGPLQEHLDRLVLPGGAVEDCFAVRRESRGVDDPPAMSDLPIGGCFRRRRGGRPQRALGLSRLRDALELKREIVC